MKRRGLFGMLSLILGAGAAASPGARAYHIGGRPAGPPPQIVPVPEGVLSRAQMAALSPGQREIDLLRAQIGPMARAAAMERARRA